MAYIDDLDEVRDLVQLYIDGSNGDVGKLEARLSSERVDVRPARDDAP